MALGGETDPRMSLYAGALILFALWQICGSAVKSNRERWTITGLLLAAGGLAGLLFLVMIEFKVKEFWETFHQNAQRVSGETYAAFLLEHVGLAQAVIGALFVMAGLFIWRQKPKDDLARIGITIALVFPFEFFARFTGHGTSRWFAFFYLHLSGNGRRLFGGCPCEPGCVLRCCF
jgi:hypothetical protein